MISGGYVDLRDSEAGRPEFVELWSPQTGESCNLPPLPSLTYGHSQDGDWQCGGWDGDWDSQARKTCHVWAGGRWESKAILLHDRFGHVSWNTQSGLVLLGGEGAKSKRTAEIIKDGVSELAFPLRYKVVLSCAIRDGVKIVYSTQKAAIKSLNIRVTTGMINVFEFFL